MIQRPTHQQLLELERLTPAERRAVFANPYSSLLFFAYYHSAFLKSPFADFHLEWAEDFGDLITGKIHELGLFTFRESAKSSLSMSLLIQAICSKWFRYINCDAQERENSERVLFEVVLNLQTNPRIRFDYGELFNAPKQTQEKTQKRVTDFLTTSDIRCEAHTTQSPIRGRRHKEHRPDFIIMDDFENLGTIRSEAATKEVREHLSELKGGIDQKNGRILYLGNRLSETGNVQNLIERSKDDPYFRVRQVWILKDDGSPAWPERHVLTDDELRMKPQHISIETIRRSMRDPDIGDANFEREMLGNPIDPFGNGYDKQNFLPLFPDFEPVVSQFTPMPPHVIGVDPGGEGTDETAIVVRSEFQAFIFAREKKSTGKSIAALVLQAMREYDVPAESVVIDSFGVGFKALQELSLLGYKVKAVNLGESTEGMALDDDKYFNDRACVYFRLKEWLAAGGALSDDPVWKQQAKIMRFLSDGKNKKHIISKKELIKRGHRSPDVLDSLALSFAVPLQPEDLTPSTSRSNIRYTGRWSRHSTPTQ